MRFAPLSSQDRQVASHRATSSPNQNHPPRGLQLFEPCWQSRRPPKTRFTRSRGMALDTLNEQDDVVPPRPRMTVWVVQVAAESTGAESRAASPPPLA